ncbi:hypothetical protein FACS1894187_22430 [Synergistales bacterium]|nr:hypothetical protein FACS1894187_22430 [Synergistales bacterium]
MAYSKALAERVKGYLDSQGWHYDFDEEDGIFKFGLKLNSKLENCRIYIFVHEESLCAYAQSPVSATKNQKTLTAVAEYIARVNYSSLLQSNFDLNLDNGDVRVKSVLLCDEDHLPGLEIVRQVINASFLALDKHGDGLLSAIYGSASKDASTMADKNDTVEILDLLLSPEDYIGKKVKICEKLYAVFSSDGNFWLQQGREVITIYYKNLSKEEKRLILSEETPSEATFVVEGIVEKHSYSEKPYIMAQSVSKM